MSDSDRPTSEMPVVPSFHVCKPDDAGYCGDAGLICGKCGHKGMETDDAAHEGDKKRCPRCGYATIVESETQPGSKV